MRRYYLICVLFLAIFVYSHTDSRANDLTFSKQAQEYRNIGYAAYKEGNFDKAHQFLKKSVYLNPNYAVAHNDLGIIYDKRGFKDLALTEYLEAARLDPQYAPVYMNLAFLYRELGNQGKYLSYLKKRASLGKRNDPWRMRAEQLLKEYGAPDGARTGKDISEAAEELNKAEALMEESVKDKLELSRAGVPDKKDYFNSAKLNYEKGFCDKALEEFKIAQGQLPDNIEIAEYIRECKDKIYIDNLYREGKAALEDGNFALAITRIAELLSLDPIYKNAEEILASAEKERFIQETKPKDEPIILHMP